MEETDVGRVLAAAVPEMVPTLGDLPERARVLGRRRRRQRAFMTSAGASVAAVAVAGAVIGLGGFGSGTSASASSAGPGGGSHAATSPLPGATPSSSRAASPPSPGWPSSPMSTAPSMAHLDPNADQRVLAAVKAALPAADAAKLTLYRGASDSNGYGAEYNWGPRSDETGLDISVGRYDPNVKGTPSLCEADPQHCTKGNAMLHGDNVRWEYYHGSLTAGGPSLNVYDDQGRIAYLLESYGPQSSHGPGLDEMKGVLLDERVASALLSGWPNMPNK